MKSPRGTVRLLAWFGAGVLVGASLWTEPRPWGALLAILAAMALAALVRAWPRVGFGAPVACGTGAYLMATGWVPAIAIFWGDFPAWVGYGIYALFLGLSLVQFLLFHFVFRGLDHGWLGHARLALPCAWLVAELLTPRIFPWMIAYPLVETPLAQLAELGGPSLPGFMLMWWAGIAIEALLLRKKLFVRRKAPIFAVALVSVALVGGWASWREARVREAIEVAPRLSVAMVQGNLDPVRDFAFRRRELGVVRYRVLSESAIAGSEPQLLIWPESAVGFDYRLDDGRIQRGGRRDPIPGLDVPLLFGGQVLTESSRPEAPDFHNAALLMNSSGELGGIYTKKHLFPFSETLPFSERWPWLAEVTGLDYFIKKGHGGPPLLLIHPALPRRARIATLICYESVWPGVVREMLREHPADILVEISNNGWFLESHAVLQHHVLAAYRAIETRRYLLRATNSGLTAVVDPLGRTVERLPSFEIGQLRYDARLLELETPFLGPLGTLPVVAAWLLLAAALWRRRPWGPPQ